MSDRRFGVDEAGKGPVLGSMFAATVVADPADLPEGLADSKKLSPGRREELAALLRDHDGIDVGVAEIPPERIDEPETDMNTLTVEAHAEALSDVPVDGLSGIVDAGDVSEKRFAERVAKRVESDVDLRAEHGADDEYDIVAAASVIAKVERDAHVTEIGEKYDSDEYGDLGSGYPSDPNTREFLATYVDEHGDLPGCARESWSTCADVLAKAEQSALGDF